VEICQAVSLSLLLLGWRIVLEMMVAGLVRGSECVVVIDPTL
jgi:hypothetical protein